MVQGLWLSLGALGSSWSLLRRRTRAESEPIPAARLANVLIIRLDLLGDLVFSLPAALAIKRAWPGSRVTMLTLPYTAPLAAAVPEVDTVISIDTNMIRSPRQLLRAGTYGKLWGAVLHLRAQEFDLALSLWGLTSSLLAFLSRSRARVGFQGEGYPGMLDRTISGGRWQRNHLVRRHEVDHVMDLVSAALPVVAEKMSRTVSLPVDADAARRVDELLLAHGLGDGNRLVVFHSGSSNGHFKRWPPSYFASLASMLERDGVQVVVVGSASESELARVIAATSPAVSLTGQTNILELIALLDRADAVVSGDSGPLHAAAAVATPVVAIYGPTDPLVNGPRGPGPAIVLRRDLACSPCYRLNRRAECPLGDPICMRLVTPDQVYAELRTLLRQLDRA